MSDRRGGGPSNQPPRTNAADPCADANNRDGVVGKIVQHSKTTLRISSSSSSIADAQGLPRTGTVPNLTRGLPPQRRIRNVDKVIAVASAKGGVGKSTIAGMAL